MSGSAGQEVQVPRRQAVQLGRQFRHGGVQPRRGLSCRGGSVVEAGQLRRRSAAEADCSAVEAFGRGGVQTRRGFSCGGGSVVEAGQPQRRSAAEAGGLAAEAFGRGGVRPRRGFGCGGVRPRRGFGCGGVRPHRKFGCGGGSVVEAGQPQRCLAAEAGSSATEAFGRRGGHSAVEAI